MSQVNKEPSVEQTSILHRLAPELRNGIFGHLLQGSTRVDIARPAHTSKNDLKGQDMADPLALARTCKQFHEELAARFYAANAFHLAPTSNETAFQEAKNFLTTIGPANAGALQGLVLSWRPRGSDTYQGAHRACGALRTLVQNAKRSAVRAQLVSMTKAVHIELHYCLGICRGVRSATNTMRLDCAKMAASLRSELDRMVQMSVQWSQERIASSENSDHKVYLLDCLIFGVRGILDEDERLEGAGVIR